MSKTAIITMVISTMMGLLGCATGNDKTPEQPIRLQGFIAAMDYETEDGEFQPGRRISGAILELNCPDDEPKIVARSNQFGRFIVRDDTLLKRECELLVRHGDYVSRTYLVDEACPDVASSDHSRGRVDRHCGRFALAVRLVPNEGNQ